MDLTIVSEKGSFGQLKVNLIPTDSVNVNKNRRVQNTWVIF